MSDHWRATPGGKLRARGIGIPFDGTPGPLNAITDVDGVEVGYCTLVQGEGALVRGVGPIRTGVTAIVPRGREDALTPVFAGYHSLNGNGELTGSHWIAESGQFEGPITITNTHSCGVARDATIRWMVDRAASGMTGWGLPVAAETYDGNLNDINGFHVREAHVLEAIDAARGGPIEQGSVGGGTGMICYDFKGGSGTASRRVAAGGTTWTVGVFVQSNFGIRRELVIAGVPVGKSLPGGEVRSKPAGSVIAVVATDAPLLPHQLARLARRVGLGLARTGAVAHNGSGDIFLAFSTANRAAWDTGDSPRAATFLANDTMDPLFAAVIEATEEAVVDSMVANQPMTGRDGVHVRALPHEALAALLSGR
ncbi:MAG: P1 family peptidase [Ectothiorhodospiraceae bacterium]|nr:P1 family peptidase [Chromatiales bacterium]MCP5156953.1 P1 family peptidase [Ectothiorhodospiraceae bacterium]